MIPSLADGSGAPLDQGVVTFLLIGAFLFGWMGWARLRGGAFRTLPRWFGWAAVALAGLAIVLSVVVPLAIRPDVKGRPSTAARLSIESPAPGQTFVGHPASVPVRLRLAGGRVVPFTSYHLVPNEGHIHLYLDGGLVSMTYGPSQRVPVAPGAHVLQAEFVAVDHAPFSPRVRASVPFTVRP